MEQPATGFSSGVTLESEAGAQVPPTAKPEPKSAVPTTPWWVVSKPDSELRLEQINAYRGAPNKAAAIGLLFSLGFAKNEGYRTQLAVYNPRTGAKINGQWQRADNPKLLYFVLPAPGRYLLSIRAGLRDAAGHTFNHSLSGPVDVPPPGSAE